MPDSSETFRSQMVSRLYDTLPQDQLQSVLAVLDSALQDYDITRKPVTLVPASGIPEVVKYFLASKAVENLSRGTLKIYRLRLEDFFRRILSAFFGWLVANEYIIRNPCSSVECIKHQAPERIPLTPYELEELRWVCRTVREKALVDLLFSSGIRASECSAANLSDIDWDARSIVIRHGKGDKRRTVYFNAESELSLRKYLETRQDDCEALFVTIRRPHHRLGIRSIETEVGKIGRRCENHVFPHRLRHTFATAGLRGGMPLDKLQALMGHAKPETTLIYAKQDQTDLQREHSRVYA